jgi:hypothetical protein
LISDEGRQRSGAFEIGENVERVEKLQLTTT